MKETSDFFNSGKHMMTLVDVKPKLNREDEKRIRLDFTMPLTADIMSKAPEAVQEAFYAISKDGHALNPIGVVREYQGANVTFFATRETVSHDIKLEECNLRQLEVRRPKNKIELQDGDVTLKFHVNAGASRKLWNYAYENYGASIFATFEDAQPLLPNIKTEEKQDDGQGSLDLSQSPEAKAAVASENDEPSAQKKNAKKKTEKKSVSKKGKKKAESTETAKA